MFVRNIFSCVGGMDLVCGLVFKPPLFQQVLLYSL